MGAVLSVWCVGSGKFVREVSPLIDQSARVKWIADSAALARNLVVANDCAAVIVDHSSGDDAIISLQHVKVRFPRARRLVVVDACELKTLRTYLDGEAANEIVYRPIDRVALLRSCGLVPVATQKPINPPTAPSHV